MNKPVVITSGQYKGYNALTEKINNNKLKLDISFESFFLPKNDKNITIVSENKLLLSANVFTDIVFKVGKQDISKTLNLDPEFVTKFSDNDWIVRKIFTTQEKEKIKEYGFVVVKENKNFSFLQVNNLILNYISGPNDTVQIASFDAYIKIDGSFLEKNQNKSLKMFFYPFFFRYSDLIDNDISNDIVLSLQEYNSKQPKNNQLNLTEYIERFLDKKSVHNNKKTNHYTVVSGTLAGRVGKVNKSIPKKMYDSYTLNTEETVPLDFGVPIIIGNNTYIQNNFWQIKINKTYPLVVLRLETDNKTISLYRDEFKNSQEIESLESSLKNLGLSSEQVVSIIKEEIFLDENQLDTFSVQEDVVDFEQDVLEDNQELDYQDEPEDVKEEQIEEIVEEISDDLEQDFLEEENNLDYQVSFKDKDQFTQNQELNTADEGLLKSINQLITIFKGKIDNTRKIFNIVKMEKERRKNERFDVNNFIYASIIFFSDKKDIPKKIKVNKKLLEEYTNYLKTKFNAQTNPGEYLSLKAEPINIKKTNKTSYYYSNIWKNNQPKYLTFKTTQNNTSRIKNDYLDLFEEKEYNIETEYLISLKKDSVFDNKVLYQIETLIKKGKKASEIIEILTTNGINKELIDKYLKDFLQDREIIPEFKIQTSHVIIKLLEFIQEVAIIENGSSVPYHIILNRFISQNTIKLSIQSFSNIIHNLNLSLPGSGQVYVKDGKIHNLKIKDYFSDSDTQTRNIINLKITEIENNDNLDIMFFNDQEIKTVKKYISQEILISNNSKISLYDLYRRFFKYFKVNILESKIEVLQNSLNDENKLKELVNTLNYVKNPLENYTNIDKSLIPIFGSFERLKEILILLGFGKNIDEDKLIGFSFKTEEFNLENFYSDKLRAKKIIQKELDLLYSQFLDDISPYFEGGKNKQLKTLLPTVDDFYSIAFLVGISDKESLYMIIGYKTEQIIEVLSREYNVSDAYVSELIKKSREKAKDKAKDSLLKFIENEKNTNIGVIEPDFFDKVYLFVNNNTVRAKKNNDIFFSNQKEYYMKPLLKNFPKENTFLNNIKNIYIDKIVKKMRELEERKLIAIIEDVETEIDEVDISMKKSDKFSKKISSYFPRKTEKQKNLSYSKIHFNHLLAKEYQINRNLSIEIIKELEDRFIDIYIQDNKEVYDFELSISLYNKWKKYTWGDNQSLPNTYKSHINLLNFIDYSLKFFFVSILEEKIETSKDKVYQRFLYYYQLGQKFSDFSFENYLKSIVNMYYGVIYKDIKIMLTEMFFEKKERDFDDWIKNINEQLNKEGKPLWDDRNNIIKTNYYKIFGFLNLLSKNIKKQDILDILDSQESIIYMRKYKISFDLSQALEPFISKHLTINNIQNILREIKKVRDMTVPDYKFLREQETGLQVQETINTVQTKNQIIKTNMFNIVNVINTNNSEESDYMSFFQNIVFWRGVDKESLDKVWAQYYKAYNVMKSLSLFQYNEQKDVYTIETIIFFLSLSDFSDDQINLLKVVPKKNNIDRSKTDMSRTLTKETQESLLNWILDSSVKRKRQNNDQDAQEIEDLSKRMRSSTL